MEANIPFEIAKTIRSMLDAERQKFVDQKVVSAADWDDEIEPKIQELVFEE